MPIRRAPARSFRARPGGVPLRRLLARLAAYAANDDPRLAAANVIALSIAANQPFYPLYLHAVAGAGAWPIWGSLLTTPFFLIVPAIGRRAPAAGRALVVLAGVANSLLCVRLIGEASGLELFLLPCITVAAMLFGRNERRIMLPLVGLPIAAFLILRGRYGAPLVAFSAEQYSAMLTVNAISVASLTGLLGLVFSNMVGAIEARR